MSAISVVGISAEAAGFIESFLQRLNPERKQGFALIPMIGLVHSSTYFDETGKAHVRGEHFVLAAISRSKIDDELLFDANGIEVAIRIPSKLRFFGKYYFDLRDGELVNTYSEG
jgi:hypothetical protein